MKSALPFLWALGALLLTSHSASAFTVKRNVNAAEPPQEQVVIFDKAAGHDHLKLIANGADCTMGYAEDGAIQIRIQGNGEVSPEIRWEPSAERPASFSAKDYNYVILRCQWSGQQVRTFDNGRTQEQKPTNPWFTITLLDKNGERTSSLNVASISGQESVPYEMTTMKIPMALFLQTAYNDPSTLQAIAFKLGSTHSYNERDYTFTIEKIALAN